jgi:hypothetical protein
LLFDNHDYFRQSALLINIRRNYVTKRVWDKFQNSPNMYSITHDMANLPPFRLKSRKPLWKEEFLMQPFSKSDYWKAAWQEVKGVF